ncbi:MAG: tetratricopeptide repeat protein [Phycisphaerales bacterium]|nr:MAG: tetratricopeptide repeat protein [Phycisphaerales bacterium]
MATTDDQRMRVHELIDQLWNFHDPVASEHRFAEAIAREPDPANQLVLMTQQARSLGLQRRFDEAHALLERVEQTAAQHPKDGRYGAALPWYVIERGRVFNSAGDRDAAQPLFEEAWKFATSLGWNALAVDAAHMLAIVAGPEESQRWNERALDLAESSDDERARRWRASLLNNLGWTYHDGGEYERALDHFERALEARKERGQERETLIARWAVARCLRSLGRTDEALSMQRELMTAWDELGEQDGYVFEEIGECLLLMNQPEEARPHFASAHDLLQRDPWVSANQPEHLARLAELGEVRPDD